MLRLNLFTYRSLRQWLENPFGTPPLVPQEEQLSLNLNGLGQAIDGSRVNSAGPAEITGMAPCRT